MTHACVETNKVVHIIKNWSSYENNDICDSTTFFIAGYAWFLRVYPKGKADNTEFISVYLYCLNPPEKEEISVKGELKFFCLKYPNTTICKEFYKQFTTSTKAWGWRDFVSLVKVQNPNYGFIRDDTVVITAKFEIYQLIKKQRKKGKIEHQLKNFSRLNDEMIKSEVFEAGSYFWTLTIFPRGNLDSENMYLSMYLQLENYSNSQSFSIQSKSSESLPQLSSKKYRNIEERNMENEPPDNDYNNNNNNNNNNHINHNINNERSREEINSVDFSSFHSTTGNSSNPMVNNIKCIGEIKPIIVKAKFFVVNQKDPKKYISRFCFEHTFTSNSIDWGSCKFVSINSLTEETGGSVNDIVILRAEVEVIPTLSHSPYQNNKLIANSYCPSKSRYQSSLLRELEEEVIYLQTSVLPQSRSSLNSSGNILIDDQDQPPVININVGGSLFRTTRDTITKYDSMLSTMFSGRHQLQPDKDDTYFIDRSGKHFDIILNFMRDGKVAISRNPVLINDLLQESEFYCLQVLIDAIHSAIHEN